jgi:serine/threonine-protein kinase
MVATQGNFAEAESLYRQTVNIYRTWYGPDHPETASFESLLALVLVHEAKYMEADSLLHHVIATQDQSMGDIHPFIAVALDSLGTLERIRGDLGDAEQHEQRAVVIDEKLFGAANHQTATVKAHLAQVFMEERKFDRAEPLLRQSVRAFTERPLPGNLAVGAAQGLLGRVLLYEGHYDEAETYLQAAYAILAKQPGTSYLRRLQEVREDLGTVYEKLRNPAKAAQFRQEFEANKPH